MSSGIETRSVSARADAVTGKPSTPGDRTTAPGPDPDLERRLVRCLDRTRGREVPVEKYAVAGAVSVDPVEQRAVKVGVVVDDRRAELAEIEVQVATHERICRPADARRAALERPRALELLQREAERLVLPARVDARDVRVQVEVTAFLAEEGDRDTDEFCVAEGAGDEVAGMCESPEQGYGCLRVVVAPDVADEARGGLELGDRVEQPDFHAGPVRCRQRRRGRAGGELG